MAPRDGSDKGHKLENLVYLRLVRDGGTLSYFVDDAGGTECDFIQEMRDGTVRAVQVAWTLSAENEKREIDGAIRAMERFGLDESVLVTHSQSDLVNVGGRTIRVVPAHEYLMS